MTDRVGDEETLYRNVEGDPARGQWARDEDNVLRVSSSAFMDPSYMPSVDRARLCGDDATWTRRAPPDGVAILRATRIRAIDPAQVGDRDTKGHIAQERRVDAVPDPVDGDSSLGVRANPAHALLVTTPQIAGNTGAWRRVRAALALVATEGGWAIEPAGASPS